jgi:uncharacterized protein (DUF1810 family)
MDPYDLQRFLTAQENDYDRAIRELREGRKRSHWMWYVFPQFEGLGYSSTSKHFAIKSLDEAKAYLAHPVLGARLRECVEAVLAHDGLSAGQIFGSPDDLKLRSAATLFALASPEGSLFDRLLEKYYEGARDERTVSLVQSGR